MTAEEWKHQLHAQGFRNVYDWQDGPGTEYPEHSHLCETAHIILEGEMTITMNGLACSYGPGDRFDVPAEALHSARMGPAGCRYLVGEK